MFIGFHVSFGEEHSLLFQTWWSFLKSSILTSFRDSNPPILAWNLHFWRIFPASRFRLIFSRFFKLVFLAQFFAIFLCSLCHFYPFGIVAWACSKFGCSNTVISKCLRHSWVRQPHFFYFTGLESLQFWYLNLSMLLARESWICGHSITTKIMAMIRHQSHL